MKQAVNKMIRTKAASQHLRDAQRARDLIDNGASLSDIYNEFKCTSIESALRHVRAAFELGGRIIGNIVGGRTPLQDAPPSRVLRNLGQGGTKTTLPFRGQGIGTDIGTALSGGLQLGGLALSNVKTFDPVNRELDRLAGIEPDDSAIERGAKLLKLFYGPPEPFPNVRRPGPQPKRRPKQG